MKNTARQFSSYKDVMPKNSPIKPEDVKIGDFAFSSWDLFPYIIGGKVARLFSSVEDGSPCFGTTGGLGLRIHFAIRGKAGENFAAFLQQQRETYDAASTALRHSFMSMVKTEADRLTA